MSSFLLPPRPNVFSYSRINNQVPFSWLQRMPASASWSLQYVHCRWPPLMEFSKSTKEKELDTPCTTKQPLFSDIRISLLVLFNPTLINGLQQWAGPFDITVGGAQRSWYTVWLQTPPKTHSPTKPLYTKMLTIEKSSLTTCRLLKCLSSNWMKSEIPWEAQPPKRIILWLLWLHVKLYLILHTLSNFKATTCMMQLYMLHVSVQACGEEQTFRGTLLNKQICVTRWKLANTAR